MNRYQPTPDEASALTARGWRMDSAGWWYHTEPRNERGLTYLEAVKQADREDKQR